MLIKIMLSVLVFVASRNALANGFKFKSLGTIPRGVKDSAQLTEKLTPKASDWDTLYTLNGPKEIYESKKVGFILDSGEECKTDCSDHFAETHFKIKKPGGKFERLEEHAISIAWVTPDERYIIYGSLEILDTKTWKKVAVDKKFLESTIYLNVLKYSPSSRRLLILDFPCDADCRHLKDTLWEVQLP